MPETPPTDELTQGVDEIRRRVLLRLVHRFRVVKWVMGPMLLGVLAWIFYHDGALWRWATLAAWAGLALAIGVRFGFGNTKGVERFCERDFRPSEAAPLALMHLLVLAATGGLASPLLPVMFAGAHNAGLFGGLRAARTVFVMHIAGLWVLLAIHLSGVVQMVPTALVDTGWPGPTFFIMLALVLSGALSAAHLMGLRTREAVDEQLKQALLARAAALGNYRERADELTTLSAEIAHELKNPLATVKGLAALLSREAKGKDAERVAVLRREVDRMQGILDEFLNFSRPLAPLTVRRVDLGKLGREVMDLHEGIASERMISLSLQVGTHVGAVCDARKVKQILVNLLQNALDAAQPDTQIDLVVRRTGTGRQLGESVEVHVLDRGTGVPAALAERIFEAGMTTKPTGNGLGLPMARALARQHGGELRLCDRQDGPGCAAILALPVEGPRIFDGEPAPIELTPSVDDLHDPETPAATGSVREPRFDGALGVAT
jgi:two-component system sensor histidine kinase HydH